MLNGNGTLYIYSIDKGTYEQISNNWQLLRLFYRGALTQKFSAALNCSRSDDVTRLAHIERVNITKFGGVNFVQF